jgi:hypothetical protein
MIENVEFDGNGLSYGYAPLMIQGCSAGSKISNVIVFNYAGGEAGILLGPGYAAGDGITGLTLDNVWINAAANNVKGVKVTSANGAWTNIDMMGITFNKLTISNTGTEPGLYFLASTEGCSRGHIIRDYYFESAGTGYPIQLEGCCHSKFDHIHVNSQCPTYAIQIANNSVAAQKSYGNVFKKIMTTGKSAITNFINDQHTGTVTEGPSTGGLSEYTQGFDVYTHNSHFPNIYPSKDNTYYLGKNDDDAPFAWKGIILKDQTNGKYYRLELNSGALSIVDLTD